MNKEEFLEFCNKKFPQRYINGRVKDIVKGCIYNEECVGGVTGGSCWDTGEGEDPHYDFTREFDDKVVDRDLMKLVEELTPDLPAFAFFSLINCIKTTEYSQGGYYGNYSDYKVWYISFEDIWNAIGSYLEKVELESNNGSGASGEREDDLG